MITNAYESFSNVDVTVLTTNLHDSSRGPDFGL